MKTIAYSNAQIISLILIIFLSLIPILSGVLFLFWHKIMLVVTKKVYSIKFPHKIFCARIHFPGNKIERIYRIIPDTRKLGINTGAYHFTQDNLLTSKNLHDKLVFKDKNKKLCFKYESDFTGIIKDHLSKEEANKLISKSNNNIYYITEEMIGKTLDDNKIPEIDYWFNNPNPINFDFANERVDITARDVKELIESEVATKLLKLAQQNTQMIIIIVICLICAAVAIFNAYKTNQIFDSLKKAGVIKEMIFLIAVPYVSNKIKNSFRATRYESRSEMI